jgi:hypothetical protein
MSSKDPFSDKDIEKMLEENRMKNVPPQVLKGFKDDVMRRIEIEYGGKAKSAGPKPGSWFAAGFKLPRVGMTVGAGALACLIIASIAALTIEKPMPSQTVSVATQTVINRPAAASRGISEGAFEIASIPASGLSAMTATAPQAAAMSRSFDKMVTADQPVRAAVKPAALTVEEELRLIEEFDDQRFFIRQDITLDELASA